MKRLFGTAITLFLMVAGLSLFAVSPASADCPYTGCIETDTNVTAPDEVKKGKKARICIRVTAASGNAQPKGTVRVTVVRDEGGFSWSRERDYTGGRECWRTPQLDKRGDYSVAGNFRKRPDSRWKNSSDSETFRVVKRNR